MWDSTHGLSRAMLSARVPTAFRGIAQPGSAPALGAGGREFESRCPDHFPSASFRSKEAQVCKHFARKWLRLARRASMPL